MDKFDRIYAMHRILSARRTPISNEELQREMECSRATINRVVELLRDHLNAPLIYDREANGYIYSRRGEAWELPGFWLSSREVLALMAGIKFLGESGQGLLSEMVRPFRLRLEDILKRKHLGAGELLRRVKILSSNARPQGIYFHVVADATVRRQRLALDYHGRVRDEVSQRVVSPQRLVHYRNNWYLDAWCHSREGLRTFSVDRIARAAPAPGSVLDMPEAELDAKLGGGYGIFAGPATGEAHLRFNAHAARWVAEEVWHPQQQGSSAADGSYELRLPFSQPDELIGDILRHGADVEVLAPAALRTRVAERLALAAQQYAVA